MPRGSPSGPPAHQLLLRLQAGAGNRAVSGALLAMGVTAQRASYSGKGSGADVYETEDFTYGGEASKRERAKKATIYVSPRPTGGRAAAPVPISFVSKATGLVDAEIRQGWHRGHLAGLEIGGENESFNIAPMLPGFNRGSVWRGVEHGTREAGRAAGKNNYVTVIELAYGLADPRIPSAVSVTRRTRPSALAPYVTIPGDPTTHTHQGAVTAYPEKAERKLLTGVMRGGAHLLGRMDIENTREAQLALRSGNLPKSKKAQWPDDPADRPYGNLDLLNLAFKLGQVFTIEGNREFSQEQRQLIIKANLSKNGGALMSDDPADPHQDLSENGTVDFPEVDHIIPKSSGGANAFSNARVVSWELNNRVARVKGIQDLVDVTRLAESVAYSVADVVHQQLIRGPKAGTTAAQMVALCQEKLHWSTLTERRRDQVTDELAGLVADGEVLKDDSVDPPRFKPAR